MVVVLGGTAADRAFQGRQTRISSIKTYTFAGSHSSENWTIEANGRLETVTGGASAAATCTNIYTALNRLTQFQNPEIFRFTWTDSGAAVLTATQKIQEAGKEVTVTIARASGSGTVNGGSSSTGTVVTAGDGPNYWSARNWGGTAPVDDDILRFENSKVGLKWNLSQAAITPLELIHYMSFEGQIGLPTYNEYGSREAQTRYLTHGAAADSNNILVILGEGQGKGSPLIMYNAVDSQMTVNVKGSCMKPLPGEPSVIYLLGTHVSNTLTMSSGIVASAIFAGETSKWATVTLTQDPSKPRGRLHLGPGNTLTNLFNSGMDLITEAPFATGWAKRGSFWRHVAGAISGKMYIIGGTFVLNSDATIDEMEIASGGVLDCRESSVGRTITDIAIYPHTTIHDPNDSVTFTNAATTPHGLEGVVLNVGPNTTLKFA